VSVSATNFKNHDSSTIRVDFVIVIEIKDFERCRDEGSTRTQVIRL
jgi:hypothetical protein